MFLETDKIELFGEVSERSKEHAWKVCVPHGTEGSNPSLSANKSITYMVIVSNFRGVFG